MNIHEFNNTLWLENEEFGLMQALLAIDYGINQNIILLCAIKKTGELKHFDTNQVRLSRNYTTGLADEKVKFPKQHPKSPTTNEQGYEILDFKGELSGAIKAKHPDGTFGINHIEEHKWLKTSNPIHSVLRKSDGAVFAVNEITAAGEILSFEVLHKEMFCTIKSGNYPISKFPLSELKKLAPTHEGKEKEFIGGSLDTTVLGEHKKPIFNQLNGKDHCLIVCQCGKQKHLGIECVNPKTGKCEIEIIEPELNQSNPPKSKETTIYDSTAAHNLMEEQLSIEQNKLKYSEAEFQTLLSKQAISVMGEKYDKLESAYRNAISIVCIGAENGKEDCEKYWLTKAGLKPLDNQNNKK